jgi:hypothetical protein
MRWEQIVEAPIAKHGNWDYDPANIAEFSKAVADADWRKIDTIQFAGNPVVYDVLRHRVENAWKVGRLVTKTQQRTGTPVQVYDIVFFINFRGERQLGHRLKYPRLYRSYAAGAAKSLIGSGIAKTMLRYFIERHGYTIICDYNQYLGARRLWASLSREPDFATDVVDVSANKVIALDALIDHGPRDSDIDPELWSFNSADPQKDIFFILRKK